MGMWLRDWLARVGKNHVVQIVVCVAIIIFIANLSALADAVLHPDIAYFDAEHVVVGSVAAIVCTVLFAMVIAYVRHLHRALEAIKTLESLLHICCHCKRIRKPGCDAQNQGSWQSVEAYVSERTASQFSHGICPECQENHYSDVMQEAQVGSSLEATGERASKESVG
jgi:hypothetical protein